MYIPKVNEEKNISILHALVTSHPLGTWVTHTHEGLIVNHIPFMINSTLGENGTLVGHVAKANPIWKQFSSTENSVIIFQGVETYITPSWYPSKNEHGKALPTWNYAVVHAYGLPRIIEDKEWLLNHLNELTDEHESEQALPWKVADAPEDYIKHMLKGVVGIEIPIAKLEGKWKVNQNKQESDKLGVIEGLLSREDAQSKEMASYVQQYITSNVDG
ncbi:FMN-binding negative transcriptional regulator [Gammaproteobacteria bacterium]|nr:FMN-binding negative transcriptional regulator [Gammaproteobacteria bacterium]